MEADALSESIMHVRDILAGGTSTPTKIGTCQIDSKLVALPMAGNRIQLVWLEEAPGSEDHPRQATIRLVEANSDGTQWAKPRVLFQRRGWDYGSLAAVVFEQGGRELVLAIWRGDGSRLTYTVRVGPSKWSDPVKIDLAIGRRNWLVRCTNGFALITNMRGNLFWCYFDVIK